MVMRASLANHAKAGGAEGKRSQAAPKLEGGGEVRQTVSVPITPPTAL